MISERADDIKMGDSAYIWSEQSNAFMFRYIEDSFLYIYMNIINKVHIKQIRIISVPYHYESEENPNFNYKSTNTCWCDKYIIDWYELQTTCNVE